jgi:UDP-N-acetylglucosamine 2-epimerase (non-hydrolysing)
VGIVAAIHFAPTEKSAANLLREGKKKQTIFITGNTAIDAMKTTIRPDYQHPELAWCKDARLILLTAHRRENWGEPLHRIFRAVKRITEEYSDVKVIYPVHRNPRVQSAAYEVLGDNESVHLIEPLNVLDFHNFLDRAYLIMTDSGGIQEEAPSLGKPVLVLRDTTERPEGVEAGTLKLVGTDEDGIYCQVKQLLDNAGAYEEMARASNPYGNGTACDQITAALKQYWGMADTK